MFPRQGRTIVPFLAVLGGMLMSMGVLHPLMAQPPQDASSTQETEPEESPSDWTAPDWMLSANEAKQYFKVQHWKDRSGLKSINPGPDQVRQIKKIVDAYLSLIVHEENSNLPKVVEKSLNEFHQQLTSPNARQIAFDEILSRLPELLNHPDDLVRYNLIAMVAQMSVKPAQFSGGVRIPAVPYNSAFKPLIQIVQDPDQFLGCRILAARGLMRICRDGENAPSSNEKSDIATALVKTLAATPPSPTDGILWFRLRLIEALGYVDRIDNSAKQPIVLEALLDVITNRNEDPLNRALAAQSITQLPYASDTNVPLITSEIMKLLAELSAKFNKAPAASELREPFLRIFFAFRPPTAAQAKNRKWGLLYQVERAGLASSAPVVKSAWDVAFPIIKPFFSASSPEIPMSAIPAAQIQALTAWLQENPPANRKITPDGKEYLQEMTEPQAAVGTTSE